jgi:hypothetical protein
VVAATGKVNDDEVQTKVWKIKDRCSAGKMRRMSQGSVEGKWLVGIAQQPLEARWT